MQSETNKRPETKQVSTVDTRPVENAWTRRFSRKAPNGNCVCGSTNSANCVCTTWDPWSIT